MTVVGHLEQLRQSACYQKSAELSCLTCHNPHMRDKPKDLTAFYRKQCLNCHAQRGCSLELAERLKKEPTDNCMSCHMPRGKTDIPHIAFTHHRIGKHQPISPVNSGHVPDLVAIDDAPQLTNVDRERNLGLGYVVAASRATEFRFASTYLDRARALLERAYKAGLRDGPTLEGLATVHWQEQRYPRALALAQEALATNELSIEEQIKAFQIVLEVHLQDHQTEEAIAVLEKVSRLRRFSEDWRLLGACYLQMNQPDRALQAFRQALAIQPFRPEIHSGLADVYRKLGDSEHAREHQEKAELLAQNIKR
jgi:predicted CXXCH cytochrome family protein